MIDRPPTATMLATAKIAIVLICIGVFAGAFALLKAVLPEAWALGMAIVAAVGVLRG